MCPREDIYYARTCSTVAPVKKATTYEEQISILRSRGVVVEDDKRCIEILKNLNYYRFIAYFLPYKIDDENYERGTRFFHVYRLYEFDQKMLSILFSALEDVEISLRSRVAYYHAHKYGPVGYLDSLNFNKDHVHDRFIEQIDKEIDSNKKVLFVKHHLEKYNGVFPIWVVIELFTFGMLSRFYSDLPLVDQKHLARYEYGTTPANMRSWLRCCSDLRNICAHYGRLYYRIFTASPAGVSGTEGQLSRLWGAILALRGLFIDQNRWNDEVVSAISQLISEYAQDIDLYRIAFPSNWEALLRKE